MENNSNISGEKVIKADGPLPDILTQISKEKFRRRLLIASRLLAFMLIIVLLYFSYTYYEVGNAYKTKPCWSCGYYFGKQCTPVVVHGQYVYNSSYIENYRNTIAEFNERPINLSEYLLPSEQNYYHPLPLGELIKNLTDEGNNTKA